MNTIISGKLVDIIGRRIYPAEVHFAEGTITEIKEIKEAPDRYILPGFIDAHIHIESSMMVPTAFARLAVRHGTVATISDPHEIANVCGIEGVRYMIENAKQTPFKFFFGAPSCVPATQFETSGATLDADTVTALLHSDDIWYLSEVMNYPGVLHKDPEVMGKIAAAKESGKPVDGHAPGLMSTDAQQYAAAGISTDHECFTLDEALGKIACGMHILIREGSAAKNFEALAPLLRLHPGQVMFCSDDKHPDELLLHHINDLVRRSISAGYDMYDVLQAACINPVTHYKLPVGQLRKGEPADFIVVKDLENFEIIQTWINGDLAADGAKSFLAGVQAASINNFHAQERQVSDLSVKARSPETHIKVIEAIDGQLVTSKLTVAGNIVNNLLVSDTANDILKLVVIDRYQPHAQPAIAFIKNFGFTHGAIASTIAHDCHNIIAVGVTDADICSAINAVIKCRGGISVADGHSVDVMPLPVAGLMSMEDGENTAAGYTRLHHKAKALGSPLRSPFMTLSFMALLVIPSLKLSDKGLFDGEKFTFTALEADPNLPMGR